jgi:D-xylose transport system permease protein
MTETPAQSAPQETKEAAEARIASAAIADFGIDTTSMSTREAVGDYLSRLRAGQLGSLPALLGLAVLVILFATLSDSFFTLYNVANLLAQGAGQTIIAMGIVFVLLLGEIDLSAGTASGVCGAVMALHFVRNGNLLGSMGSGVFIAFLAILVVAALVSAYLRIWVGAALGCLTGFLVSKIGMPSFVVTLALFLVWQGVILQFIGQGGTLGIGTSTVLNEVANGNLSTVGSWLLFVVGAGGFAAVMLGRHFSRLRRGLVTQPTPLVLFKVGGVALVAAVATLLMTLNRAPNANIVISGVPYVVPIVLALLTVGTYVLNRTQYGRHIYAVGGNQEAARRAGINVSKIRASVFVICSSVAAIGAIVYSSKVGSVDPQAGGLNTLLFAVGAAVIGGTSLFGGKGRVFDAVIGGLVLAVVSNGLGLLQQSAAVVNIITGLVLLLAATVDALSRRRAATAAR